MRKGWVLAISLLIAAMASTASISDNGVIKALLLAFASCPIAKGVPQELNRTGKNGNNDDAKNEKAQVTFYYWHVTEEESAKNEEADPEDAPKRAVGNEMRIKHFSDAGDEGGKGTKNR